MTEFPKYLVDMAKDLQGDLGDGRKDDTGKLRWDLLPLQEVGEVVKVLTSGAVKYGDNNWQRVPGFRRRYFAAAFRHFVAWWLGETHDLKTGYHHLAHACCSLLFLMWFDAQGKESNGTK